MSTDVSEWDAHYAAGKGFRLVTVEEMVLLEKNVGRGYGERALDVACGTGGYAAALHDLGFLTVGVDYSPTAIHQAKEKYPGLDFLELDIEHDDLARLHDDYDLITCRLGWAFMGDKPALLERLRGLLVPGGVLHITTPHAELLPDHRKDIGITAVDDEALRGAPWAETTTYDLPSYDTITCYVLRRR